MSALGLISGVLSHLPTIAIVGVAGMVFTGHGDDLMKFGAGALNGLADTLDGVLGENNAISDLLRTITGETTQAQAEQAVDANKTQSSVEGAELNEETMSASETMNEAIDAEGQNNIIPYSMPGLSSFTQSYDADAIAEQMIRGGYTSDTLTEEQLKSRLSEHWLEASNTMDDVGKAAASVLSGNDGDFEKTKKLFFETVAKDKDISYDQVKGSKYKDIQNIVSDTIKTSNKRLNSDESKEAVFNGLLEKGAYVTDPDGYKLPVSPELASEICENANSKIKMEEKRIAQRSYYYSTDPDGKAYVEKVRHNALSDALSEAGVNFKAYEKTQEPSQMPLSEKKVLSPNAAALSGQTPKRQNGEMGSPEQLIEQANAAIEKKNKFGLPEMPAGPKIDTER